MIDLRCSSLPRILSCPASRHAPAIEVQGDDDAARLGSAVHVAAELHVKSVAITGDAYTDLAAAWKVDVEELRILSNLARLCWDSLSQHFPAPTTELALVHCDEDGMTLSGHPDVFSIVETQARVGDFKTGRTVGDHEDQLRGYGYLLLRRFPEVETFWGTTIHVRTRTNGDPIQMTRDDLDDWYADLVRTVGHEHYRPSHESCQYCPRRLSCPARNEFLRDAAGILAGTDVPVDLSAVPDEQLRMGVIAARHLKGIADAYLDAAKTEVLIRGHIEDDRSIVCTDGLQVRNQDRKQIVVNESWPILTRVLSLPVVKECLTISKTKVEKALGDIAPLRGKGKLVKAVMEELAEANALATQTVQILEVKPTRAIGATS